LNKALYSTHEAYECAQLIGDVQEIIHAAAANVPYLFFQAWGDRRVREYGWLRFRPQGVNFG